MQPFEFEDAVDLPEFEALPNDRMRAFVWHYAHNGQNVAEAARAAECTPRTGYGWLYRADITAAMGALCRQLVKHGAFIGIQVAVGIAQDPTHKDQLKAALSLAAIGGFGPQSTQHITVEKVMSSAEKLEMLKVIAQKMGQDPRALLEKFVGPNRLSLIEGGVVAEIIENEFDL